MTILIQTAKKFIYYLKLKPVLLIYFKSNHTFVYTVKCWKLGRFLSSILAFRNSPTLFFSTFSISNLFDKTRVTFSETSSGPSYNLKNSLEAYLK